MVIFVLETSPVAFSWFPEQNRAQCNALSLLGCGLGLLCILLQALGDFLSFLFIESSPCLQHPLCLELLPAVHSSVLCCWWLCISLSGTLGAALLLGVASCPRLLRVLWGWPRSLSHGAQAQPGQRKRPLSSTIKETQFQLPPWGSSFLETLGRFLKC